MTWGDDVLHVTVSYRPRQRTLAGWLNPV
jgi:hypothetical protein